MNLNSQQAGLNSLHKAYQRCLTERFDAWMKNADTSKDAEWCVEEKTNYMEYMRINMPTQYENLMRMEDNNF